MLAPELNVGTEAPAPPCVALPPRLVEVANCVAATKTLTGVAGPPAPPPQPAAALVVPAPPPLPPEPADAPPPCKRRC